ncbi:MAG TPA: hypothetical protein VGG99_21630 [Acetobacteraceae bacterium]|jgi:hypothetical protein
MSRTGTASVTQPEGSSGADQARPAHHTTVRCIAETAAAFALSAIFYRLLYSQMPYHDVARFRNQIESGHFVWDIAHIFLQPATLLWHRYLGLGESAVDSQRHINTFATALAVAIFYAMLRRLRFPAWQRIFATALVAGSASVVTLAPTGHMKLLAFPFVNAALFFGVVWERERPQLGPKAARMWIGCAAMLGLAASFLASALATGPFATLAVLVASRRAGDRWSVALRRAIAFGAIALLLFLALACFGFIAFSGLPLSADGLRQSVTAKADLKPPDYALTVALARLVFSTATNIAAAPALSDIGRALISRQAHSVAPFYRVLAEQSLPVLLTLALLAAIYVRSAFALVRGAACIVPIAFLLGAQAWTIYYGVADPEHWFQLTAPTVLLFLLLFSPWMRRWVLPVWAGTAIAANLAFVAVPVALYPLDRYQAELQARFTPRDLVIDFMAFPGRPWGGVFQLPHVPRLELDMLAREVSDNNTYFATVKQQIDAAFARGGHVYVLDVLDPNAWDAPWPELYRHHITKPALFGFFNSHYDVRYVGRMAEVKAWELTPRPAPANGAPTH